MNQCKFYFFIFLTLLNIRFNVLFAQESLTTGNRSNFQVSQTENIPANTGGLMLKSAAAVITTDKVLISDSASRADHNLQGTKVSVVRANGFTTVSADSGWFSFDLACDSVIPSQISCSYYYSNLTRYAFDVYVEGVKLYTQRFAASATPKSLKVVTDVPLALSRHKSKITVKFQSKKDSIAGPLFYLDIKTTDPPGAYWPANIHDPSSIIKCDDKYYIFGTGDGIYTISSTDRVKWRAEPTPFAKWGIPSYIFTYVSAFEGNYWAPECIFMNGKYYLYYSASQWGTKLSCIGVVTNLTLNPEDPRYQWKDLGLVVSSNHSSNYNAIDPSVIRDPQTGKIYLTYGSFNVAGIKVTELDSVSGKIRNPANQYSVCNHYDGGGYIGEASFMIYHSGYYYLFVNYGGCCSGVNSSYYIITGRSASPTGPFLDKAGANLYKVGSASGGTIVMKHDDARGYDDRYYGPGCLGYFVENGFEYASFHYYDPNFPYPGQPAGGPMLAISKLEWGTDGWPIISFDWLAQGRYKLQNKNSSLFWDINSTKVIQADNVDTSLTQQWDLYTLGTGEYKIANSTLLNKVVETSGVDRNGALQMNSYLDTIYQKFRALKSATGDILFYQSSKLMVMQVPSIIAGAQLGVASFSDSNNQKWYANRLGDIPTAVNSLTTSENYKVFPNPVSNNLSIQGIKDIKLIEIIDTKGNVVYSTQNSSNDIDIPVSNLRKGIYLVRFTGKNIKKAVKVQKI